MKSFKYYKKTDGKQSTHDNRGEPTEKLPSLAPVPDAACLPFPSPLECQKLDMNISSKGKTIYEELRSSRNKKLKVNV